MRVRVVTITKSSPRKAPPKKDTYLFTKLRHTGSVKGEVFSLRLVGRMWGRMGQNCRTVLLKVSSSYRSLKVVTIKLIIKSRTPQKQILTT